MHIQMMYISSMYPQKRFCLTMWSLVLWHKALPQAYMCGTLHIINGRLCFNIYTQPNNPSYIENDFSCKSVCYVGETPVAIPFYIQHIRKEYYWFFMEEGDILKRLRNINLSPSISTLLIFFFIPSINCYFLMCMDCELWTFNHQYYLDKMNVFQKSVACIVHYFQYK